MSRARLVVVFFVSVFNLLLGGRCLAQITNVSDPTSTPTPGLGHDYIKLLSETVNPATGALSVRISVPVPPGRQLTVPFAFTYDSSAAWFFEAVGAGGQPPVMNLISNSNIAPLAWGGWATTFPQLSRVLYQQAPNHPVTDGHPTCEAFTGYVFTDPTGARHSLGLTHWFNSSWQACEPNSFAEITTAGDDFYRAALVGASNSLSNYDGTPEIAAPDGTVYNFGSGYLCSDGTAGDPNTPPPLASGLPVSIEDRNGNIVSITTDTNHDGCSGFIANDTLGRPALSVSQYGYSVNSDTTSTVYVAGLSQPYYVTWSKISPTGLSISHQQFGSDSGCDAPPAIAEAVTPLTPGSASVYVVTAITLPNGQQYQFGYDGVTGFINKITYPSHGYVSYTWGINPNSSAIQYNDTGGNQANCVYTYDTPAITQRQVSFDGITVALTQNFSYPPGTATNWGTIQPVPEPNLWVSKQTTVTTTDNIRGTTSKTVYNYLPNTIGVGPPPNINSQTNHFVPAVAVENTIYYYGYSPSYPLLRTETKGWVDPFELACDVITLNDGGGQVRGTFYGYSTYGGQVIDKQEFDYGQLSSSYTSSCLGGGALPTPTRETKTAFETFAATPIYPTGPSIFDRPCQIVTYGSGGTRVAETDLFYDSTTSGTPCATATTQALSGSGHYTGHDETYYGTAVSPPRGNLTGTVRQCFNGPCGSGNPTTTYTYDETGQVLTDKDANGNTTGYSYGDTYSSGTPPEPTNAYLTTLTDAVGHTTTFAYGYADGQLTRVTDPNGQTTSYAYNTPPTGCTDGLDRLSQATYPDGGSTAYCYNDSPYSPSTPSPSVTTTKVINSSTNLVTLAAADGLGHVVQTRLKTDPDGPDYTATTYDGLGRSYQVYNPTRCSTPTTNCGENTWGYTTTAYDGLGRTTSVTLQDGSVVTTVYSGNTTTVTDPAGVSRESVTDGLGRLTQVFENPTGFNYETLYTYDALNNLLTVNQEGGTTNTALWRTRTFAYDSLSRLLCASNPENSSAACPNTASSYTTGTTGYAYDANGNLLQKTSLAPAVTGSATVTISYCYDPLNRVTGKAYTAQTCSSGLLPSPLVSYYYDQTSSNGLTITNGIGRRTGMTDQAGTEAWSYDSMGRPLVDQRTTNSLTNSTSYVYLPYVDGAVNTITYPSGRTLTYTTGGAERLLSVQDNSTSVYYASSAHYTPPGALSSLINGSAIYSTQLYNTRLQLCWLYTTTGTALATSTACTASDPTPGNIIDLNYNYNLGSSDNGNVIGITNNRNITRNQVFAYDALNRITTAQTTSTYATSPANCWSESYFYDNLTAAGGAWGNLTSISGAPSAYTGCVQESGLSVSVSPNNRLSESSNACYDNAGNLVLDTACPTGTFTPTYSYDAENHLVSANGTTYLYDGDGRRVLKGDWQTSTIRVCQIIGGTYTCQNETQTTFVPTKLYWYDPSGNVLDETDGSGSTSDSSFNEYVFFGGQRLGRRDSSNDVFYYFADHLGTSRTIAEIPGGQTTATLCYDADFYSFGGERTPVINSCSQNYKFSGKERDSESGLDDFDVRYYSSSLGRFMRPDPAQWAGFEHKDDPQAWNGYAYGRNNPLLYTDPDGANYTVCDANGQNCADLTDKQYDQFRQDNPNLRVTPGGDIYTINENGTETRTGSESYYNEKDVAAAQTLATIGSTLGDPRTIGGFYGLSALGGFALYGAGIFQGGFTVLELGSEQLLTNQAAGQIIGWGTGQAGTQATQQLTQNLTKEAVQEMIKKGLNKATVEGLKNQYARAAAEGGAKMLNQQLLPRLALMEKIIQLWPK